MRPHSEVEWTKNIHPQSLQTLRSSGYIDGQELGELKATIFLLMYTARLRLSIK
jgi:hypothetical protein